MSYIKINPRWLKNLNVKNKVVRTKKKKKKKKKETKNLPKRKNENLDNFTLLASRNPRDKQVQSYTTFPEYGEKREIIPNLFYEVSIISLPKPDKEEYKKEKNIYASFTHKHILKYPK